ncbi:FGGY-family carbohydrate kinase [Rubrobacter calidifluminis]|uniref:FGGY-family carbohydrate kinase n=1 Tax=Rubrobacter calidifluminis TaxID=1392640 RepID=UPI0023602DC0|nr:FGGY-family carbohydrate kinase [Rubrobacter calidifluminis]
MAVLLGIDSGLTNTRAVLFDETGNPLGASAAQSPQVTLSPGLVERDMEALWETCVRAVRGAISKSGIRGKDISAVGVSGHGDGLYLVDHKHAPVRAAILSLDSRSSSILEGWRAQGLQEALLRTTGRSPRPGSPAPLFAWLQHHEPESVGRTRWILNCKDWIRLRLTGEIWTDPTEANSFCGDIATGEYRVDLLEMLGLEQAGRKLPPIKGSIEIAGRVTREAAEATGLDPGTPVVGGLVDALASMLGTGCTHPGRLCMVSGTWGINGTLTTEPVAKEGLVCRRFATPGYWALMSNSPSSAANLGWFVEEFYPVSSGKDPDTSRFKLADYEASRLLGEGPEIVFLPFINGSSGNSWKAAAFLGLRSWHTRGHMVKALMEGVAFDHKHQASRLGSRFDNVLLSGGGTRSQTLSQIFADALWNTVTVSPVAETGAWGAAICAAVGAGVCKSLCEIADRSLRGSRSYEPDPSRAEQMSQAYEAYLEILRLPLPPTLKEG